MAPLHIQHGKRRLPLRPWLVICRCGLAAWPCPVVRIRERQAQPMPRPAWTAGTVSLPVVEPRQSAPLLTRGQRIRGGWS